MILVKLEWFAGAVREGSFDAIVLIIAEVPLDGVQILADNSAPRN